MVNLVENWAETILMPPCPLPVWPSYHPAPPPQPVCHQSSYCNQNVIFPPLPPSSVQSSFPRLCFGAGVSVFGKEHHQSTWDVLGSDRQCRAESYPPWEPSPGHHAPEVGPWRLRVFTGTLKIIIQPFLSTPRKNHPGHLLKTNSQARPQISVINTCRGLGSRVLTVHWRLC